jgi:type II secretory pathway component GspD/PulD (secretin)
VRLKNSETAAVAGFLERQLNRNLNGTPGIGGLSGVGLLASDQNNLSADTELLILITPHMVSLAPRKDHEIYAGRGALEGPGTFGPVRPEPNAPPRQPLQQTPVPNQLPAQPLVQPPQQQQPPPPQPGPVDSPPAPPPE